MSVRTEDPTGNRYVGDQLADRYTRAINDIEATVEARQQTGLEIELEEMLALLGIMMTSELARMLDLSILRGASFAIREISIPPFHVSMDAMEKWPADVELRENIITESHTYINNVFDDIRAGNFDQARTRADQIARTETMHGFNESARSRYKAFGIKRYRFHAHLDCCSEPKTLSDGSVVERGCEELHNQTFPIDDTVHLCPIHPLCRCTILPVF